MRLASRLYGVTNTSVLRTIPRGFREVDPAEEIFLWWKDADTRLVRVGGTDKKPVHIVVTPVGVNNG